MDPNQSYHVLLAQFVLWMAILECAAQATHEVHPGGSCSASENCATLSSIANNTENFFASDSTLLFYPGDHVLCNKKILVTYIRNLTLQAHYTHNATGYLNLPPRIVCINSSFSFLAVSELSVIDIHFVSCRFEFNTTTSVFQNSKFENGTAYYGGAVAAYSGSSVHFRGVTMFIGNVANLKGGAVYTSNSNPTFSGETIFTDNYSPHGGAIYTTESDNLTFAGSSRFSNNTAQSGGALYVQKSNWVIVHSRCLFTDNKAVDDGGALWVSDVNCLLFHSDCTFEGNTATDGGALLARDIDNLTFSGNVVFKNNTASSDGGAVYSERVTNLLSFNSNNTFAANTAVLGGGLYALDINALMFGDNNSTSMIAIAVFEANTADCGGALFLDAIGTLKFNTESMFKYNGASIGGALLAEQNSFLVFNADCTFEYNTAHNFGGAADINEGNTLIFNGISTFKENTAEWEGGAFSAFISNTIEFNSQIIFQNNYAYNNYSDGGAVYIWESNILNFQGYTVFQGNQVKNCGGGLYAFTSNTINFGRCAFEGNTAVHNGGALWVGDNNTLNFNGTSIFVGNTANSGGAVWTEKHNYLRFNGHCMLESNSASLSGGALYTDTNNAITFNSRSILENNTAEEGGALYAHEGNTVIFQMDSRFERNSAQHSGGALCAWENNTFMFSDGVGFKWNTALHGAGIYMQRGQLTFDGTGTFLENNTTQDGFGGAILSVDSLLILGGEYNITGNKGGYGGGLALTGTKHRLILKVPTHWAFNTNYAYRRGGAIYVQEEDLFSYCPLAPISSGTQPSCFLQVQDPNCGTIYHMLTFESNSAIESANTLYGGTLESCQVLFSFRCPGTTSFFGSLIVQEITVRVDRNVSGSRYLARYTNANLSSDNTISSDPFKVCFCYNEKPDCTLRIIYETMFPGQVYLISLVAVGQMNGTVPSTIRAVPQHLTITSDFNAIQLAFNDQECSELQYPLLPEAKNASLKLYSDEPCSTLGIPLTVQIEFHDCPVGFTLSNQGNCICDERLQKYTRECLIQNLTISREDDESFWVGIENRSGAEELVLHPYCPFDYCTDNAVNFQLNDNGTDLQCANRRSGVLCGTCQQGYSLALGSSRCLPNCSEEYLALLLAFALAGVILVGFLFLCRLTVAEGTLSGLIFYANILAVNQSIFFPSGSTNPLTLFIAWLNLDIGIETCFYKGLDTYSQTWLQFVFPIYIWVIVGVIIYFADTSTVVAKVIGRTNPVAVLATLFLFSYTKLLRAVMVAFSFTTLSYPNDDYKVVWLYDGNIGYLDKHDGRHIALFLFSLLVFLFIFLPYTLLLFSGQWILSRFQLWWISPTKQLYLKAFLDAYYAPFTNKHRYWTGLLLLVRFFILLLTTVINIGAPQDPFVLLVVLLATLSTLQLWVSLVIHRLYKKWYLDVLEASFSFNLIILIGGTYQIRLSGGNQSSLTYTSVSVAFVTFIGIVGGMITRRLEVVKFFKEKQRAVRQHSFNSQEIKDIKAIELNSQSSTGRHAPTVTCTVVDIRADRFTDSTDSNAIEMENRKVVEITTQSSACCAPTATGTAVDIRADYSTEGAENGGVSTAGSE